MEKKSKIDDRLRQDNPDRDETLREDLNMETDIDDLSYNADKDSYEIDTPGDDPEYQHPATYDTAVENGGDADSDFDEANPTAVEEYDKDEDLEEEMEDQGLSIDSGKITKVSRLDEKLAMTPEDYRNDLDEEGYPKNDMK